MRQQKSHAFHNYLYLEIKLSQRFFDRFPIIRRQLSQSIQGLPAAVGRVQPDLTLREHYPVQVIPHHVLVVSEKTRHVSARRGVLKDLKSVRASVNHVSEDEKAISPGEIYLF